LRIMMPEHRQRDKRAKKQAKEADEQRPSKQATRSLLYPLIVRRS